MTTILSQDQFRALGAQGYNRVPLVLETFADLDTPLSIYLKLADAPYSYLLESVQGGERFGRYSFIGLPAQTRIVVRGTQTTVLHGESVVEENNTQNPLDFINTYKARFKVAPLEGLPRFSGGLVGLFGYETVNYVEPKIARRATANPKPDPLGLPDIVLLQSEELAIVDNLRGKLSIVVYADPRNPSSYQHARERLQSLLLKLRAPIDPPAHKPEVAHVATSNFGEASYLNAVKTCKKYIVDGDIMQVQIGQRLSRRFTAQPLALYRSLRTLNPSPYMAYFNLREFHMVSASPEILVRLEGDKVTLRPIAGTRPRGATPEADAALATELLADPKERAEHVMLIDLGRNDVGRVAATGSVKVTDTMVIERYSHVMHIVSNVEGKLKAGLDAMDVLKASFPAGTVTGTPKVRAMEIIHDLEPAKRGLYAGAFGYLGFHGDMDVAITIRTGIIKDQMLYVQAAAGVVADSIPEMEWNETNIKARAVLRAAELASAGLDSTV